MIRVVMSQNLSRFVGAALVLASLLLYCAARAEEAPAVKQRGTLYVYRLGSSGQVTVTLRVNAESVGRLDPNTFYRWELPPGAYQIMARSQTNVTKRTVQVEPGKSVYVQQSFVVDFRSFRRVKLSEMSEERGSKGVEGLTLRRSANEPGAANRADRSD